MFESELERIIANRFEESLKSNNLAVRLQVSFVDSALFLTRLNRIVHFLK